MDSNEEWDIFLTFTLFFVVDPFTRDSPIAMIVTVTNRKLVGVEIFQEEIADRVELQKRE